VRRGICQPCKKTFTILPDWLTPSGHYSLLCRQQSCERIAAGDSVEQAPAHCKDPTRLPDPSTVRRWAQRRLLARFWSSFRTSRDLAIVGLMLLQGLRSQEVLDLNRDDLLLPEAQIRVRGKGNKTRFLPLAPEAAQLLDHYLRLERPTTSTNALFVSLKGAARGIRMTPAGLRSLFRHHRRTTGVKIANPHRFRHTFASDMVRAGVSLPALMQLMGHAQIQTTLVYMQVTPLEVYQQYARAVAQLIRPVPVTPK